MSSKKKAEQAAASEKEKKDVSAAPEKRKDEQKAEPTAEEKLQKELEEKQKELDEKQAQLLSLAAEYDNFRKRSMKERESIYADVRNDVLKELLPVIDNMERALEGDSADAEGYKKGVEMTFAGLMTLLEKSGVASFGQVGDDFDPAFYNAVMHVEDENLGEQKVAEVFQKGYKHGDKVLRAAMVKVAN